jgi:hypothetical protein
MDGALACSERFHPSLATAIDLDRRREKASEPDELIRMLRQRKNPAWGCGLIKTRLQFYSDNLQAARQRNHSRQATAARNTTVFQASGSVSLPVTIAAKIVTAANPHIKAIARLIKQTTIQRRRTICGLRAITGGTE